MVHFKRARALGPDLGHQVPLPQPRLSLYGVIDERLDIVLIDAAAAMRPEWQLVMIGQVVKIDPLVLPMRSLALAKPYEELPLYLAGRDVALVSTPITDVVRRYGTAGLARIAVPPGEFIDQCDAAMRNAQWPAGWLAKVERALGQMSWDLTYPRMRELMRCAA